MDPWWNPAAEMQAIDRTHRLGKVRIKIDLENINFSVFNLSTNLQ